MKSSPSIWQYVVSVKSTVKISSFFVAFLENTNFTQTPFFVIVNFLNRKKFCQFHYCDYSSVRLVALLLQHEAAMTSFGGTMAHLTHFGLLHNGGKSSLKEHKVHIFLEGHKILRNIPFTFDCMYCSQK